MACRQRCHGEGELVIHIREVGSLIVIGASSCSHGGFGNGFAPHDAVCSEVTGTFAYQFASDVGAGLGDVVDADGVHHGFAVDIRRGERNGRGDAVVGNIHRRIRSCFFRAGASECRHIEGGGAGNRRVRVSESSGTRGEYSRYSVVGVKFGVVVGAPCEAVGGDVIRSTWVGEVCSGRHGEAGIGSNNIRCSALVNVQSHYYAVGAHIGRVLGGGETGHIAVSVSRATVVGGIGAIIVFGFSSKTCEGVGEENTAGIGRGNSGAFASAHGWSGCT